jgi:predicted enzyme related to lactoylglutathione lyase
MKIKLTSVFVDDQDKALKFYTEVLGFVKKREIPAIRWLTVVSPEEPDGPELLLEPNNNPAVIKYQKSIFKQGIHAAAFAVEDIYKEFERIKKTGVIFLMDPTKIGPVTQALFDDTCGNIIQIYQV